MIVPRGSHQPRRLAARAAAWGGLAGLDISLIVSAATGTYFGGYSTAPFIFFAAAIGVGVAAFIALLKLEQQRKRTPFGQLEGNLTRAGALLERGLIDEEEYQQLKAKMLNDYRHGRGGTWEVLKPSLFGFLVGMGAVLLPFMFEYQTSSLIIWLVSAAGGSLAAGSAATLYLASRHDRQVKQIEGPGKRRMLGDSDYSQERPR